ncbi:DUF1613-domain-containing protein [Aulographum hederae CBS 113979]|uniref:tRNA (uracil-O(2)-)-methyltransferase n=1 Tax=Aulographum hederae CBS 113979 TaxID=1176131 RepID=A0A6G1HEU4_9PEZI|nr:DUF1613-domain-containing protein [Aulographum hederae CBS 113979]
MAADTVASQSSFSPKDLTKGHPIFSQPGEIWLSILSSPCSFNPDCFHAVITDMVENPNRTSSHLFRAEIFFDSLKHVSSSFAAQMKAEYRPISIDVPEYELQQSVVRRLIPRNPQLDKPLVQTCHLLRATSNEQERNLLIMIPHTSVAKEIPWYHPSVRSLAILHQWCHNEKHGEGELSIHYKLFESTELDTRLERTALNMLKIYHKHGQGHQAGYVKRVHHDQVISQKAFQDTYTRLKTTYAKSLIGVWVEQTDPAKHVFEDLGIAAFLIELWNDMYSFENTNKSQHVPSSNVAPSEKKRPPFPGFIDIGCGNGVLVHILTSEGYSGTGFDARARKTWSTFPQMVQDRLSEKLLVPSIFQAMAGGESPTGKGLDSQVEPNGSENGIAFHDGIFPNGTFIISNHADELTGWTPLLAHLNQSPFIAIPCCSHSLSGARFRAPAVSLRPSTNGSTSNSTDSTSAPVEKENSDKTGQLQKRNPKIPSAYAALCDWIARLTEETEFVPEKEMLRIPSTRNAAIIGRKRNTTTEEKTLQEREDKIRDLLKRELGVADLERASVEWIERAEKIRKCKGGVH